MEISGFGSFTSVEHYLSTLTVDEKNELYLSGELDRILDEAERESKNKRYQYKTKKTIGGTKGEILQ